MNGMNRMDNMSLERLLRAVVGACFEVSNVLGAGFLEKVYEKALVKELELRGLRAETNVPIPVFYKGEQVGAYLADIIVEGELIVELKCCDALADEHTAQCINYLHATGKQLLLLVNFQRPRLEWRRIVPRKQK